MKLTLQFDTESENYDRYEMQTYLNAPQMLSALDELRNKVKSWEKYDDRELIPVEEIWEFFFNTLKENNISLEEMGY